VSAIPSIKEVVDASIREGRVYRTEMVSNLIAREDAIADALRMAGAQFGVYPEIVAKVLMDLELGTPPTPEVARMIQQQFIDLMERLQQQYRDGNNG